MFQYSAPSNIAHDDNLLFVCFFRHLCKAVYIDRVKSPGLHNLSALKETKTAVFDQTGQKGMYSYPSLLNSLYSMTCREEWAKTQEFSKISKKLWESDGLHNVMTFKKSWQMGGKKKGRQKQSQTSLLQDFPITGGTCMMVRVLLCDGNQTKYPHHHLFQI